MIYMSEYFQNAFDRNLTDWCKGGPSLNGWTRTGEPVEGVRATLTNHTLEKIDVDEVLAKNRKEVGCWHIDFLKSYLDKGFNWMDTAYYKEYLSPRCNEKAAFERMISFIDLFEDISKNGIRKPIFVADMKDHFDFRYFRFDGCHRACSLKVLGRKKVPARVFTLA